MITRRSFIKAAIGAGAFAGFRSLVPVPIRAMAEEKGGETGEAAGSFADIALVRGEPEDALRAALEAIGGIGRFVRSGARVVVKPNMGFPNPPNMATTTSPEVVAAIASLCVGAGAGQVLVLDHPVRRPEVCLERNGIREACKRLDKTHVIAPARQAFFREVKIPAGRVLHRIEVLKSVLDADVLINVPVAKAHNATGVSLGIKNLMGVIWDREFFHGKVDLNQAIADLAATVKPALTVVDATRVLTAGGPAGPGPVEVLDTIVAGVDPVAVDSLTFGLAKWYGGKLGPDAPSHIRAAHELGLGEIDPARLKVKRMEIPGAV